MNTDVPREPNALRRYELLSEHTQDIVLFIRPDGRILEANQAATRAYGYTRRELLQMSIADLRAPNTISEVEAQMASASTAGGITFETSHRRKDGTVFPVEVSSSPSEIGGVLLSLVRDITHRKRLEKTQALLAEIDHRILQRDPLRPILQMICDQVAGLFGYTLVWIAMKEPEGRVGILAHAGVAAEFLDGVTIRWDETPEGFGPTGSAIRSGEPVLMPTSDTNWNPFRDRAASFGLAMALALPFNVQGETVGAVTIYSIRPDVFDPAMVAELTHFANRVAISLAAARDQEQIRLQTVALEAAANAMVITDRTGCILWANPAFATLTGYSLDEAIGQNPRLLKSGNQSDSFYRQMWETITAGQTWRGEVYNRRKDGTIYVEEMTITPVRVAGGAITHFIAVKQDVTERKEHEEQLRHLAMHDPVTDLANRRALVETLERTVGRARMGAPAALLLLDLDGFKRVNDRWGHAEGDHLLMAVARRLQVALRPFDLLARWGGDEFAALLEGVDLPEAGAVANRLCRAVSEMKLELGGAPYQPHISIGVVPVDGTLDAADVMLTADRALYAAKDGGGNRAELLRPGADEADRPFATSIRSAALHDALEHDRFQISLQPVFRLATGLVDHYELSLRLPLPDGTAVLADEFEPAARRAGLVPDLDRWAVRAALRLLIERPTLRLQVGLSGESLTDPLWMDQLAAFLAGADEITNRLSLAVAEGEAVRDLGMIQRAIRRLKALGCRCSLDHFASGFAACSFLRGLSVDAVGLAAPLARHLESDPVDRAQVAAYTGICHAVGAEVFARGVGSDEAVALLRELGVEYGQGPHLGGPIPVELLTL